jgi:hypothetical protein
MCSSTWNILVHTKCVHPSHIVFHRPLRCVAFVPSFGAHRSVPLRCPNGTSIPKCENNLTHAILMDNTNFFFVRIIIAWDATPGGVETTGIDTWFHCVVGVDSHVVFLFHLHALLHFPLPVFTAAYIPPWWVCTELCLKGALTSMLYIYSTGTMHCLENIGDLFTVYLKTLQNRQLCSM